MKEQFFRQGDTHILYDDCFDAAGILSLFDQESQRAEARVEPSDTPGRVPAIFITAADGRRLVLKRYRRGGWVAKWVDKTYFYAGEAAVRSFREFRVLARLRKMGLPVPRPFAARYRRCGLRYTADLITIRCANAGPLSRLLENEVLPPGCWKRIGQMLRRFHQVGVFHADLNAHNILLENDNKIDGVGELIFLVDFDKARIADRWKFSQYANNLTRLRRSLIKLRHESASLTYRDKDFEQLLTGYRSSV